jgi:hypothetical protein
MPAMNEALEFYTPDEAAECLDYHPDPDNRIYKALWATLDSDLWTVFIRACDGTHAETYASKEEAWAAVEKHVGHEIHWEDRALNRVVDSGGGVVSVSQIDGTRTLADVWDTLPEDIQERLNESVYQVIS